MRDKNVIKREDCENELKVLSFAELRKTPSVIQFKDYIKEKYDDNLAIGINWGNYTIEFRNQHGNVDYFVDLERCETPWEVLDWILQLQHKTWMTPLLMSEFLFNLDKASEEVFGNTIQAMFNFRKKLKWRT